MSDITCYPSCLTCSTPSFYSCTSCPSPLQLYSNNCLEETIFGVQIGSALALLIFVIPHMLHIRRLATLTLVFDLIQFVHYFKFLTVYDSARNVYIMLGMRGWGAWSEGWNLVGMDQGAGIWVTEESVIDKTIRIVVFIAGIMVLTMVLGVVKMVTGEQGVTFTMFIKKNWLNSLMLAVYITIQDMAFIVAKVFYLQSGTLGFFTSTYSIIDLVLAILFALIIMATFVVLTYIINAMPANNPNEYFYHANMFVFGFDSGEYFPTYYSIENPNANPVDSEQDQKTPKPMKSNLKLVCVLLKVIYPFIVVSTLSGDSNQVLSIASFLLFWSVIIWTALPYSPRKQWPQILLLTFSQILSIGLLFVKGLLSSTITMALLFTFIGLGLTSFLIELFYSFYILLPVDLYNTGMKIDIRVTDPNLERQKKYLEDEKRRLEEELKRQQEENRLRMLNMNQEERRLEAERLKKQKELEEEMEKLRRQMEEEKDKSKKKQLEQDQKELKEKQDSLMTQDEAALLAKKQELLQKIRDKYKVDTSKLNPYQWDRKKKFVYSNLMTEK